MISDKEREGRREGDRERERERECNIHKAYPIVSVEKYSSNFWLY